MACEWLEEGRTVRCHAVDGDLIPSLHERERYCRSDENCTRCPTFGLYRLKQRRIAQAEYYALWTAPSLPELKPIALTLARSDSRPTARAV
jgi:hypothetical protein